MFLPNNPDEIAHGSISQGFGAGAACGGTTLFEMPGAQFSAERKFEYQTA